MLSRPLTCLAKLIVGYEFRTVIRQRRRCPFCGKLVFSLRVRECYLCGRTFDRPAVGPRSSTEIRVNKMLRPSWASRDGVGKGGETSGGS
jgi:ribosomal protein S27AE